MMMHSGKILILTILCLRLTKVRNAVPTHRSDDTDAVNDDDYDEKVIEDKEVDDDVDDAVNVTVLRKLQSSMKLMTM